MRVTFVAANRETLPDPVVPLGVLYVMRAIADEHEVALVDLMWEEEPFAALSAKLVASRPELVAIGLRNIQNADYSGTGGNIAYYEKLMAAVRGATAAPVVLGGGGFSVLAAGLMERLRPEFGVVGEGERAMVELVRALEAGRNAGHDTGRKTGHDTDTGHGTGTGRGTGMSRDTALPTGEPPGLDAIPGLCFFRHGELVMNSLGTSFADLDAIAAPSRRLVDSRYYEKVGIDSIQTKRGCALSCEYCTYPTIEGRRIRTRAPGRVVEELCAAMAEQPRLNHFFIVDSVFNLPADHAKAVCREMVARGFSGRWTCYANPIGFDAELASLMAAAGCVGMEIGSDSGCDEVLGRLRKGFTTAEIRAMSRLCREAGLGDCHTFVLGTRGETLDHVRASLDFLDDLDPFAAILMIWTDDEEAMDPKLAASRRALRADITALLNERKARHPRWIIPALGANYDQRLFRLLRRRGLAGPLWQYIDRAGTGRLL